MVRRFQLRLRKREMPRPVRIEFEVAMYHVMGRGDRREAIVRDDEDRKSFLRTLVLPSNPENPARSSRR
jgi:hypothetical protein